MASKMNPYLQFDGTAAEAMQFYQEVLGGELTSSTFGEFGATDPSITDKTMHAQLETDSGFTLMASDTAPGQPAVPMGGFSVSLSGDDAAQLRGYFTGLAEGGTITLPLEVQMWGDEFGMCIDRYGVPWMVNIVAAEQE